MAHKTLTISEEAYEALASLKGEGESFTDVVLRLARSPGTRPLKSFAGRWRGDAEETERIFRAIKRLWKGYDAALEGALGPPKKSK
jgi:predicted CopG family antitoxin